MTRHRVYFGLCARMLQYMVRYTCMCVCVHALMSVSILSSRGWCAMFLDPFSAGPDEAQLQLCLWDCYVTSGHTFIVDALQCAAARMWSSTKCWRKIAMVEEMDRQHVGK